MREPSFADAFEVLVLQAADAGRGERLFGDCAARVRTLARPYMVGRTFPNIYLEFPLKGDPFLDITVLYNGIDEGTRIEADAVAGTGPVLDWYGRERDRLDGPEDHKEISFGFEIDVKDPSSPAAAVHFQPRTHHELVRPFCELVGEPTYADLYLEQDRRMPKGWSLDFFGMFRGRPGTPLRVCGYLSHEAMARGAESVDYVREVFDAAGFTAYDDAMLAQVSEAFAAAPGTGDFQLDVYPDGHVGNTFALDLQFAIQRPELVRKSFSEGPCARLMNLYERWGIVDERWHEVCDMAFARYIPVELEDGSIGRYSFTVMPQWNKVRWVDGQLQPSKLYLFGSAGLL